MFNMFAKLWWVIQTEHCTEGDHIVQSLANETAPALLWSLLASTRVYTCVGEDLIDADVMDGTGYDGCQMKMMNGDDNLQQGATRRQTLSTNLVICLIIGWQPLAGRVYFW